MEEVEEKEDFNENDDDTEDEIDDDEEKSNEYVFDSRCSSCGSNWSPIWRRVARSKIVCNKCFFNKTYLITINDENKTNLEENLNSFEKKTRSSAKNQTSSKRPISSQLSSSSSNSSEPPPALSHPEDSKKNRKSNRNNNNKSNSSKQDVKNSKKLEPIEPAVITNQTNRRSKLFKRATPVKNEILESSIVSSDYVLYKGFYYQIGDIVALFDLDDRDTIYFAQIRAFLTDQFGDKSAVITWLIPTSVDNASQIKTTQDFDPNLFELGPAEEYPRSLDYMEFVCRLTNLSDKIKTDDLIRSNLKFKNELLRHKFSLEDLASSNIKLISKQSSENSIEYQIKY